MTRVAPANAPYSEAVQKFLDRMMPGQKPLVLFTTLARDERLFKRFTDGGLLDPGHLTLRQREIVIDRTTSLCGSEYEWGVHVAIFAANAGLSDVEIDATATGNAQSACWSPEDALLIAFSDSLHARCDVDDNLWERLSEKFTPGAIIELLMLAGFYRTVSYLTNALRLPLEDGSPRFPR